MTSFLLVATASPPRLPYQKRGPYHRDFNPAAHFFIVVPARPRFAVKTCSARRRRNFELSKFARPQRDAFFSSGQVRFDMLNKNLPVRLAHSDKVQPAVICFCYRREM